MTWQWQLRIVVETASFVTLRSLPGEPNAMRRKSRLLFFFFAAGRPQLALTGIAEISLLMIRSELPASVEKSGDFFRSTNVLPKSAAADCRRSADDRRDRGASS
jgi:hypothetical protein